MKIKIDGLDVNKILRKYKNNTLGIFVAETCARYMNPYVPMVSGMLSQNYVTAPWKVTYTQPYAHRQYTAGWEHNKEQHPLAVSYWDRAAQNAKSGQIARDITAYLKRKGVF